MAPILTANSLGGRQKQINDAVKAVTCDPNNNPILTGTQSDTDVLYQIDVASKFQNIKFLLEILKSGDSLYISRTLKQTWIFNPEHSNVINPEFLHTQVFPHMSEKMKNKMLTAISINIKDTERIEKFCDYCFQNNRPNSGYKFVLYTSDSFKLDTIKRFSLHDSNSLKKIIGKSMKMAEYCFEHNFSEPIYHAKLYSVSPTKFLDLFEKYQCYYKRYYIERVIFGEHVTEHIVKNHPNRVANKPRLYFPYLRKDLVFKHLISKINAVDIANDLPEKVDDFWDEPSSVKLLELFNIIPVSPTRFQFIKEMFTSKYPGEEFETSRTFYSNKFYEHTKMTKIEKDNWAMAEIKKDNGFFGNKDDYTWYKFVNFDYAFESIKKIIQKTTDSDRRLNLNSILVDVTSTHAELEILLKYFYERHINEMSRTSFFEKVLNKYDLYSLKGNCWAILNNSFNAMGIYTKGTSYEKFKVQILFYFIIHNIELPKPLITFFINEPLNYYTRNYLEYVKKARKDLSINEKVFTFLIDSYINEIRKIAEKEDKEEIKDTIRPLLKNAVFVLGIFKIKAENYPIIMKHAASDKENFASLFVIEEKIDDPIRLLKKDVNMLNEKIPLIMKLFTDNEKRDSFNRILRKLKIYYSQDASEPWITYFAKILSESKPHHIINSAMYGIFTLGCSDYKLKLIEKYRPQSNKIDCSIYDSITLVLQESICKTFACSRPPIQLSEVISYIRGDYLKFCLPTLGSFAATLPTTQCVLFVKCLINKPVSIRKHGLRLAFKCLDFESLIQLVQNTWKETKNVSLRNVLFVDLYKYITNVRDEDKKKIISEVLQDLMKTLNEDDDESVFACLSGDTIPSEMRGDYLEAAFHTVERIPFKAFRRKLIIVAIEKNVHLMKKDLLHDIIIKIVDIILKDIAGSLTEEIFDYEMRLIATYVVRKATGTMENKLNVLRCILTKSVEDWNKSKDYDYATRRFTEMFVCEIVSIVAHGFNDENKLLDTETEITEYVLDKLATLPVPHVYVLIWNLKSILAAKNVIDTHKENGLVSDKTSNDDARQLMIDVGAAVGDVIKQFVLEKTFYMSLLDSISKVVEDVFSYVNFSSGNYELEQDDCKISYCMGLCNHGLDESVLLALRIMPEQFLNAKDYLSILNLIKNVKNEEVQCAAYLKLCLNHKCQY